jgi:polar amino acid transport system substrate-binding protein
MTTKPGAQQLAIGTILLAQCLASTSMAAEPSPTGLRIHYLQVASIAEPFQIDKDGESTGGIITDIVNKLFEGDEIVVETHVFPVKRLYHWAENTQGQLWIAYDSPAWNSMGQWGSLIDVPLFPVHHKSLQCLPQDDAPLQPLSGGSWLIIKNFDYPELTRMASEGQLTLIPVESYQQGIDLITTRRVSGFVEMDIRLRYHLARSGHDLTCYRFAELDKVIPPYPIQLSLSNQAPETLRQRLRARLAALVADGTVGQIIRRYTEQHASLKP